jgi:hypothetical protein
MIGKKGTTEHGIFGWTHQLNYYDRKKKQKIDPGNSLKNRTDKCELIISSTKECHLQNNILFCSFPTTSCEPPYT